MLFEFNVRSGVLLLFFIIGLVYTLLLWRRGLRTQSMADRWLGTFMGLCVLYMLPWMVGFAGWYNTQYPFYRDLLFYTPFQHQLFFGPVIYFYVKTLLNAGFRFQRADYRHFIPGTVYLLWCIVVVVVDKLVLHRYMLMNGENDPDFDTWYQVLGLVSMMVYLFAALRYYYQYRRYTYQVLSYADAVGFTWVRNFLFAFSSFLLITILLQVLNGLSSVGLIPTIEYWDTWWYFLLFAFIYYYIGVSGYNNAIESSIGRRLMKRQAGHEQRPALGYSSTGREKSFFTGFAEDLEFTEVAENPEPDMLWLLPGKEKGEDPETGAWKEKVARAMTEEALYKKPDLSLGELARHLQTNTSTLSRIINTGFGKNFNDFVNTYRVSAVEEMLKADAWQHFTIMSIAYEAGFNSKATFNRAFKKMTGRNPSTR